MFASLSNKAAVAALALGLALAGPVVSPADAAVRHGGGGSHVTGVQHGSYHGWHHGYAGRGYYGGYGYGYGGYGGYGYGCPLFPVAVVLGPFCL
jgi:uncharacterized membrane protein